MLMKVTHSKLFRDLLKLESLKFFGIPQIYQKESTLKMYFDVVKEIQ